MPGNATAHRVPQFKTWAQALIFLRVHGLVTNSHCVTMTVLFLALTGHSALDGVHKRPIESSSHWLTVLAHSTGLLKQYFT